MILQALTQYYEDLVKRGEEELPVFGFSRVAVSAILQIDCHGNLVDLLPAVANNPKMKRYEVVPFQMKRSGSKAPAFFLCDNSQYVLGIERRGSTEKSKRCFTAFLQLHKSLLGNSNCIEAIALLRFLENWNPDTAFENEIITSSLSYCFNGSIVIRMIESSAYLHRVKEIVDIWNAYYPSTISEKVGVCLATGKTDRIARVHNSVKGIKSDSLSPNGWTLVCFDKDSTAFSSYGKLQGYNAPISEYAAFAYTSALNYLLVNSENAQRIGDTNIVCWAEGAEPQYQIFSFAALVGVKEFDLSEAVLWDAIRKLAKGKPVSEFGLDPKRAFYILGLSPNSTRLSVRFFYKDTFGNLMKNVNAHHERLEIIQPSYESTAFLTLSKLLGETINPASENERISPILAGATARSVFTGDMYPEALLAQVIVRIRAERNVSSIKAAMIKAYYLRKNEIKPERVVKEGAMNRELNDACVYLPYLLGRLFAVMEKCQIESSGGRDGIKRTIRDSYFTAAAATPNIAFQKLFALNEYHLRKLERDKPGKAFNLSKEKTDIISRITENIPSRFSMDESNAFYLGYYHQTQKYHVKKEEKNREFNK